MPRRLPDFFFRGMHPARYGDIHRTRNLILPRLVREESVSIPLQRKADERDAHAILIKWASLEASGKLETMNETQLQGDFLAEVFGQALGYVGFSADKDCWDLQPQFAVNDGTVDAAIGVFGKGLAGASAAMVELKGPTVNLDRDRSNGRTPVQQCWDYLNHAPDCPWGIVCNYVSFRLYHRSQTPRACQHFTLQDLRAEDKFRQFYYLFERDGLLTSALAQPPRAELLLESTTKAQREVGDQLYDDYAKNRVLLIRHLMEPPFSLSLDRAIHAAQKLLDRIIFVAFCEDRELLPKGTIERAYTHLPPFARVTNPKWRNFLDLFRSMDKGNEPFDISPFNGGLFAEDPEVDDLQLDDGWTDYFNDLGRYDFRDEVNVDVLGHIFERSVGDIGRIRETGFFEKDPAEGSAPRMGKSAERKRFGIYYTPPEFTTFIAREVVGRVVQERLDAVAAEFGFAPDDLAGTDPDPKRAAFWRRCLEAVRDVKVVDPACGSGAFLIQALDVLQGFYDDIADHVMWHEKHQTDRLKDQVPDFILNDNLFGVDLSPQAVQITQLALWVRTARKKHTLANLSRNIVCGNSLVSDPAVDPCAMDWPNTFPQVFNRPQRGFDCVIGNPPWERMKLQEREFFDGVVPEIASAVSAATRRELIAGLQRRQPLVYQAYEHHKAAAEATLDHVRGCGRFPLTGKGDINTYAVFAELAWNIVAPRGRAGILVPSGIATDQTTSKFFGRLVDSAALVGLYDFENKAPIFPDVHRSFKFSVLLFGGGDTKADAADFVFFAHRMEDLADTKRHIALSRDDFRRLNPNTRTCPVFRTRRDAEITKAIYQRVPVLLDKARKETGNPWGIRFLTMFHQTNDAELFRIGEDLKAARCRRDGPIWRRGDTKYLPLYEAKMVQAYDHRAAGIVVKGDNWMRQGQTQETPLVQHQDAAFTVEPRWWVAEGKVLCLSRDRAPWGFVGFKDITSATNQRTMIAAAIPWCAVTNHFPLIETSATARREMCLLGNLNSFALDFAARQKIGAVTLNFFIVEQLPVLPPASYADRCPWDKTQTLESWVSERVLKLTCTANDMIPLAEAAGFTPQVHRWNPAERMELMAELDAAYFLLYGIDRDDARYILSTFSGVTKEGESVIGPHSVIDLILDTYDELRARCR